LLDEIKPGNTRLLHALAGVLHGGLLEHKDALGFHMDKDMHD
jgi:hypothetical protein